MVVNRAYQILELREFGWKPKLFLNGQLNTLTNLRLPEIPVAVGTACGLRSGPPARFEARQSSPVSKHVPRCKPKIMKCRKIIRQKD